MHSSCKLKYLATFFVILLGFVFLAPHAVAQDQTQSKSTSQPDSPTPSDDGWHVGITPYIWFTGVNGTVGALGHQASVHASFGDIFNYLNIGAMGAVELRHKRLVVPLDFMWVKLSDDKGLPFQDVADSVKAKMTQTVFTPKFGFRFIDGKKIKVDALFGVRYWHLENSLTLQPTQVGGGFSSTADWVDGVGGAKIEAQLTPRIVMTILGDAGGGSAKLDYQVAGLLGLKISRRWILQAGYRYMDVDYRPLNGFIYDVNQSGLVFGATFNLK